MARFADIALYLAARLWVVAAALLLVVAVRLAAELAKPAPSQGDRVVIRIP